MVLVGYALPWEELNRELDSGLLATFSLGSPWAQDSALKMVTKATLFFFFAGPGLRELPPQAGPSSQAAGFQGDKLMARG